MSEEFSLHNPEVFPPRNGGARPGAGRPLGSVNKTNKLLRRQASVASPDILQQHIDEAQRYSHYMRIGDLRRAKFAWDSGEMILRRTMPEPRGPVIEFDLRSADGVYQAVQNGELRPGEARQLQDLNLVPVGVAVNGNGQDARKQLADRLERLVAARPAPDPVLPPEITEEQLTAMVEAALRKKLEERNV